jgi:precorrin-3B C17-methyltransferase
VGIGPGSAEHLSRRAIAVLASVDTVAGYATYIDLVRPLLGPGQEVIQTGMRQERQRVHAAIRAVLAGRSCALVSSGDPGIYAMAGLVLEVCRESGLRVVGPKTLPPGETDRNTLVIEIVPGIPALCSGASLLGAPLMHDFAAISLSDLLTPWETIEKRLIAAAEADFVVVLYNPKSKRRRDHLRRAQEILLAHRDPETPAGIVRSAMRDNQSVDIVPLKALHRAEVDMQTTVFIGNRTTRRYLDFMLTPRGYSGKYDMTEWHP